MILPMKNQHFAVAFVGPWVDRACKRYVVTGKPAVCWHKRGELRSTDNPLKEIGDVGEQWSCWSVLVRGVRGVKTSQGTAGSVKIGEVSATHLA
jgi:hypothetical protein